jgi:ectoine hydroxylase-related dioxygenase (phytanoyl-CoA dioxygenase family)
MPDGKSSRGLSHSRFGGTWIDRADFARELDERIRTGKIPEYFRNTIRTFERDGVVILNDALSAQQVARFESVISDAFREGHSGLICQAPGNSAPERLRGGLDRRGLRVVDAYAALPEALDLFSSPQLAHFLEILFEERPKLFQSLSFEMGSEQGLHQDTAYVVVSRPLEFVGCWIALEDVRAGSGELLYMVGSHRLPDFDFGGNKKHWNPDTDGTQIHHAWSSWLLDEGRTRGLPIEQFLAKRGDVLLWHADLAHGGSPISNVHHTRKSLVGHFCPDSAEPNFVNYLPQRAVKRRHQRISYCSGHYDL